MKTVGSFVPPSQGKEKPFSVRHAITPFFEECETSGTRSPDFLSIPDTSVGCGALFSDSFAWIEIGDLPSATEQMKAGQQTRPPAGLQLRQNSHALRHNQLETELVFH